MEYGSVNNLIAAYAVNCQPTPEVGMGVTFISWTDRHAGTIVAVSPNGKTIIVQADIATRADTNGMSDSQTYTYAPNPNAEKVSCRLSKRGQWKVGKFCSLGSTVRIGERETYYDFSF